MLGFTPTFGQVRVATPRSGRFARDGRLGISRVIFSTKFRIETLHLNSSFTEPNAWIMDTKNCRWHNLHLAVDGQSQQCNLIPSAQTFDNYLWQSRFVSLQPPPPSPLLMFNVRVTMLTSFMNKDRTSLMNFRRFVVPDEPNCLLCCVYGNDGNVSP